LFSGPFPALGAEPVSEFEAASPRFDLTGETARRATAEGPSRARTERNIGLLERCQHWRGRIDEGCTAGDSPGPGRLAGVLRVGTGGRARLGAPGPARGRFPTRS